MPKLVRDNIPAIMEQKGQKAVFYRASEEEYARRLLEKLTEEVAEFQDGESVDEIADIVEVLYAIAAHKGYSPEAVEDIRKRKALQNGSFTNRIIMNEKIK